MNDERKGGASMLVQTMLIIRRAGVRFIFFLLAAYLVGCEQSHVSSITERTIGTDSVVQGVWVQANIRWMTDTVPEFDDEGDYMVTYGGVQTLFFASDHRFKVLSFLAYQGERGIIHAGAEPSRSLSLGTWMRSDSLIIVTYQLIDRDIRLVREKVPGDMVVDTIRMIRDQASRVLLEFNGERYERTDKLDSRTMYEVSWLKEKVWWEVEKR